MRENRHSYLALLTWRRLNTLVAVGENSRSVLIDGNTLSIADVVAVAR